MEEEFGGVRVMEMELDLGRWRGVGGGGVAMVENVVEVGAEVVGAEGVAGGDHGQLWTVP